MAGERPSTVTKEQRERLVWLAAESIMASGSGEISSGVAESAAACIVDMVISEIASDAETQP
jgi:hypothetical protein